MTGYFGRIIACHHRKPDGDDLGSNRHIVVIHNCYILLVVPSTHVMSLWQSPGTGNLGNGQNLAAKVFDGIFVGHLNPTTAVNNIKLYIKTCFMN